MYCATCGTQINKELNFCNTCGNRVTSDKSELRKMIAKNFSIAVIFIGTFGLVGFVFLIKALLENDIKEQLIVFGFLYLAAYVGLLYTLISQTLKISGVSEPNHVQDEQKTLLSAPNTARLNEHREPAASIIEDTTKSLNKVLVDK